MMQRNTPITLPFQFDRIPKPFTRGDRALIVLKDQDGRFLLGTKNSYPEGIYRLAGGGIEGTEIPVHAACRELEEELGITREPGDWQAEQEIIVQIQTPSEQRSMKFYLFATTITSREHVQAADDLDGIAWYTREDMYALIDRFYDLMSHVQPGWGEYGMIYAKIHEIAMTL